MSAPERRPRIRRADPALLARPAAREGRADWPSRLLKGFLAAFFSAILVIPRLRAVRRTRHWVWVRAALLLVAAALALLSSGWWRCLALAPALLAIVLRGTVDPDRERRIQRVHGADYLLNGGEWAGSSPGGGSHHLAPGTPLYLLVRGPDLLLVPREGKGEVHSAVRIDRIERILVDGRAYVPVFVSEAKQPPAREREADRHAVADLVLDGRSGEPMRFRYRGSFARHLAETAAHAVFSVRMQLASAKQATREA